MADQKITDLSAQTAVATSDLLEIVRSSTNYKMTVENLLSRYLPGPYSYTVFLDGGTTKAINHRTNKIEFSDTDAGVVFRSIMEIFQCGSIGGTLGDGIGGACAILNGVYNFNSLLSFTTSPVNPTYYGIAIEDGTNLPIAFHGETNGLYDWVGGGVPHAAELPMYGVIFNITSTAVTSASSNYIVGFGSVGPTTNSNVVDVKGIRVRFPTNQRGNECGFSFRFCNGVFMENCHADFAIASPSLAVATASGSYAPGIETQDSTEGLSRIDRCIVTGYYEGYAFNCEHLHVTNCLAQACVYPFSAGSHGDDSILHTNIISHFKEAHCINGPRWGGHCASKVLYELPSYDLEVAASGIWVRTAGATESSNGNVRVVGNYSAITAGTAALTNAAFWESGHGANSSMRNSYDLVPVLATGASRTVDEVITILQGIKLVKQS